MNNIKKIKQIQSLKFFLAKLKSWPIFDTLDREILFLRNLIVSEFNSSQVWKKYSWKQSQVKIEYSAFLTKKCVLFKKQFLICHLKKSQYLDKKQKCYNTNKNQIKNYKKISLKVYITSSQMAKIT